MLIYSEIKQPWHTEYCQLLFGRFFEWRPSTNSIHAYTRNGIMPSKPVVPIAIYFNHFGKILVQLGVKFFKLFQEKSKAAFSNYY